MKRLINLSATPQWGRLLLGGLAASVLLHLLVLDAWREPGSARGNPAGMSARAVVVRLAASPASAASSALPVVAQAVVAERRPEGAARAAGAARPDASASPALPIASAGELSSPTGGTAERGLLRPLTPAEGRVAYRLALLEAAGAGWPEVSASGVLLELALGADGQAASMRLLRSAGDAATDQLWLARLQYAVRRASVPDVLQGRAFALEMEFLP